MSNNEKSMPFQRKPQSAFTRRTGYIFVMVAGCGIAAVAGPMDSWLTNALLFAVLVQAERIVDRMDKRGGA
jgi:hypothetical protein